MMFSYNRSFDSVVVCFPCIVDAIDQSQSMQDQMGRLSLASVEGNEVVVDWYLAGTSIPIRVEH